MSYRGVYCALTTLGKDRASSTRLWSAPGLTSKSQDLEPPGLMALAQYSSLPPATKACMDSIHSNVKPTIRQPGSQVHCSDTTPNGHPGHTEEASHTYTHIVSLGCLTQSDTNSQRVTTAFWCCCLFRQKDCCLFRQKDRQTNGQPDRRSQTYSSSSQTIVNNRNLCLAW